MLAQGTRQKISILDTRYEATLVFLYIYIVASLESRFSCSIYYMTVQPTSLRSYAHAAAPRHTIPVSRLYFT